MSLRRRNQPPDIDPAVLTAVEAHLETGRRSRSQGDGAACIHALERAAGLAAGAGSERWIAVTSWRLAKAHYDFGEPRAMLDSLGRVLAASEPFAHYPAGVSAVAPIARRYWDALGYDEPLIARLWTAAHDAHRAGDDPFLAATAHVHLAWHHACRGELDEVAALLDRYMRLTPREFGDGPHRHPEAHDTPTSLWFVQMDLARTLLRAATWADDDDVAWTGFDAYEDALEDAGLDRTSRFWFLEPAFRAGLRFGWPEATRYDAAYRSALATLDHPRRDLHVALGEGLLTGDPQRLAHAARAAGHLEAGAEWQVDALLEACRAAGPRGVDAKPWLDEASDLATTHGLHVFAAPIRALHSRGAGPSPNTAR